MTPFCVRHSHNVELRLSVNAGLAADGEVYTGRISDVPSIVWIGSSWQRRNLAGSEKYLGTNVFER